MDEKNGMNFSEYMAILSGNTDLLEKAKLEKRIVALESERKSFNKGISDSRFRLQTISHDIANNEAAIERMKADYARYEAVVQRDKDGNPVNSLVLDDCKYKDEQNMGIHLQGLARKTDTHGKYVRVGEVYGFPISIISEPRLVFRAETQPLGMAAREDFPNRGRPLHTELCDAISRSEERRVGKEW